MNGDRFDPRIYTPGDRLLPTLCLLASGFVAGADLQRHPLRNHWRSCAVLHADPGGGTFWGVRLYAMSGCVAVGKSWKWLFLFDCSSICCSLTPLGSAR